MRRSAWSAKAFQPTPQGKADCGVAKIASNGRRVLWATYLGGSDYDSIEASVDVDDHGYVYVGCQTRSHGVISLNSKNLECRRLFVGGCHGPDWPPREIRYPKKVKT